MKKELKEAVFEACRKMIAQKIAIARRGMEELQAAANEETKSSAGDKYETGRAMMQLEKDKFAAQLAEAIKLQTVLSQINIDKENTAAGIGSLVFTNTGIYFLGVSLGKIVINENEYFLISLVSPIGSNLKGKRKGDKFEFNGRKYEIQDVY